MISKESNPLSEPIHISSNGAMQSEIEGAWHLLDSEVIDEFIAAYASGKKGLALVTALLKSCESLVHGDKIDFIRDALFEVPQWEQIVTRVMARAIPPKGKYEVDNWRGIPSDQHINHAVRHWFLYIQGYTPEEDFEHFICRSYFALCLLLRPSFTGVWTPKVPEAPESSKPSYKFSYDKSSGPSKSVLGIWENARLIHQQLIESDGSNLVEIQELATRYGLPPEDLNEAIYGKSDPEIHYPKGWMLTSLEKFKTITNATSLSSNISASDLNSLAQLAAQYDQQHPIDTRDPDNFPEERQHRLVPLDTIP